MRSVRLKFLMVFSVLSICIGQSSVAFPICKDCEELFQTGNVQSGYYDISPDGQTIIRAYCYMTADHGWTVINPSLDPQWAIFFNGWNSYADGLVYSNGDSWSSWRQWFTLADANTVFALCPDCQQTTTQDAVYKISGNYYGCFWWNRNCDYDGECHQCIDDFGSLTFGTCPWFSHFGPDDTYPYSCDWDWWNRAPSIGANGSHCVAYYKPRAQPILKWQPFWFLNARVRLVRTPVWVTVPTGYWGGWYWWHHQCCWLRPWQGPLQWYWPHCYEYSYWKDWAYWPYYRYYLPWWHYWQWKGWPYFWGFKDCLTYRYWRWNPSIVYFWSYYWDPAGQGNCLELVTMSDEDNPAGGRILPLDPNVINHLEVQSHQFSVNGGKVEGDFSQLEYIPVSHLEHYYRNIPDVNESDVQTFMNSDIVKDLMKNDPSGQGSVGVQYAQWQHPEPQLIISNWSGDLPLTEGWHAIEFRAREGGGGETATITWDIFSSDPNALEIQGADANGVLKITFDPSNWNIPQPVVIRAPDNNIRQGNMCVMLAAFREDDPNEGFAMKVTILDDECGGLGYNQADLNHDCKVNFRDLALFANGWLVSTEP